MSQEAAIEGKNERFEGEEIKNKTLGIQPVLLKTSPGKRSQDSQTPSHLGSAYRLRKAFHYTKNSLVASIPQSPLEDYSNRLGMEG